MSRVCRYTLCQQAETTKKGQIKGYNTDNGDWYCSHRCFVLDTADQIIERKKKRSHQTIWKMQLGLLLLKRNLIDQSKLNQALLEKNRSGKRIGEILVDSGHISEADLKKVLSIQAGVAPISIDPGKPVCLSDVIPGRFYYFFCMSVFNVSEDEKVISVAVSDVQDLSYLQLFFDRTYPDYLCKFYLDSCDHINANLNLTFANEEAAAKVSDRSFGPIIEQQVEPVILNFLQFLDRLGGKNTKLDHLDQSLWVRSELEGHQVDIYLTPKGK